MKALSLARFVDLLPTLVSGINNVIVATYNNLTGCENGGEFTSGTRRVSVICGGAAYANFVTFSGFVPSPETPTTKQVGDKTVSEKLTSVGAVGVAGSLVILYAGTSHFDEMVELAKRLAGYGAMVVLVSRGCDASIFDSLETFENITCVIPQHSICNGGRIDLTIILNALLDPVLCPS